MSQETKSGFVNLQEYVSRPTMESWAEDTDFDQKTVEKPKGWEVINKEETTDLTAIMREQKETKNRQQKQKKINNANNNNNTKQTINNYERHERNERYDRRDNTRNREKQPIPTEGPYTAFVGNLPFEVKEEDIKNLFSNVTEVRLIYEPESKKFRGFGYVVFSSAEALSAALEKSGQTYGNRQLNIDVAKPSKSTNSWGTREGGSSSSNKYFSHNRPIERSKPISNTSVSKPTEPGLPPKIRGSIEDPLGGVTIDVQRMNELAMARIQRDLERDAKKKEEEEKRRTEEKSKPKSPREQSQPQPQQPQLSWRSNKPLGTGTTNTTTRRPDYSDNNRRSDYNDNHRRPDYNDNHRRSDYNDNQRRSDYGDNQRRSDYDNQRARTPRNNNSNFFNRESNDTDDGFRNKNVKTFESIGTGSAVRASEAHVYSKIAERQAKKEIVQPVAKPDKVSQNPFSTLDEADA